MFDSTQVPRATAALNTLWQIGTALLAVVLQQQSAATMSSAGGGAARLLAPLPAGERAQTADRWHTAFGHTFVWAAVMALLAILPAVALLRAEHASRRPSVYGSADCRWPAGVLGAQAA